MRVKVRNKPVIDGWAKDAARTGKVTLAKGKPVSLVVEYFFDRGKGRRQRRTASVLDTAGRAGGAGAGAEC